MSNKTNPDPAQLDEVTERRLALFNLGYHPVPTRGKAAKVKGWNGPDYPVETLFSKRKSPEANIAMWPGRHPDLLSTGVRIDHPLRVLDFDTDDAQMMTELLSFIDQVAPEVGKLAPTRFGGGEHKLALFCRAPDNPDEAELFEHLASRKYTRPGDGDDDTHSVEAFGARPGGKCHRHFGIAGPHSYVKDAAKKDTLEVARWYEWDPDRPLLHETPPQSLPLLSRKIASAVIDKFDELALARGWTVLVTQAATEGDSRQVYDITDETRFNTDRGERGIDYDELCTLFYARGEFRVSSSFITGVDTSMSKCWVNRTDKRARHPGVIAIYNHETGDTHYSIKDKPGIDDDEIRELGAAIRELKVGKLFNKDGPAALGKPVAVPIPMPNWRERKNGGGAIPSLHNARLAIEAARIQCSEDVFHMRMFIGRSPAASPAEPLRKFYGEMNDARIRALRGFLSDCFGLDFTEKHVRDAVLWMAHENQFNPVAQMLDEAQANWDGVERLDRMAVDFFNCADTRLNRECVRKTMIGAVDRVRNPGCKFDTMLVLEGKQGFNKSSAWLVLAGEDNFSDGKILGKDSREVQEQLAGIWIHENADLSGMRKADANDVMAFASRRVDSARPAYGYFLVKQPRHSIEVGTTNDRRYLPSQVGNRRFWGMEVERMIDLDQLRKFRLQLWGEAATYQKQGESTVLDPALWPDAAEAQEERRVTSPWEELLAELCLPVVGNPVNYAPGSPSILRLSEDKTEERVSTVALFEYLQVPKGQMSDHHSKKLADAMRANGWVGKVLRMDGKAVRGYARAVRVTRGVT